MILGKSRGNFLGRNADVDKGSGMRDVFEGTGHRAWVARCIGHDVKEVPLGDFPAFFEFRTVSLEWNEVFDSISPAAKIQPFLGHVHYGYLCTRQAVEFERGQTDRPRPDDQSMFSCFRVAPIGCMATNGKGLDQGELFEAQFVGRVKFVSPDDRTFAQPAIHHDSEDLEVFAAVSLTFGAGMAFPAIQVGFDRATIPGPDVGYAFSNLEHFHAQFVAGDARVVEKGKFPQIAADVRSADAHSGGADEGFSGSRFGRLGGVKGPE